MKSIKSLSCMAGRKVFITGGGGHLGMAMCEALAENGADIILLDMNEKIVGSAVEYLEKNYDGHFFGVVADLEKRDDIDKALEIISSKIDNLDVLINCAALVGTSDLKGWAVPVEQQDINVWERALNVNLTAAFYLTQKFLRLLNNSSSASIINVGSIYGVSGQKTAMYEGMNYLTPSAYAVSKGGLVQMTRYLASTLAPIRVNCISPGGIERNQPPSFVERYKKLTPLGRLAKEEDFKGITCFLASDLSAYITGQNIIVDGGWSL